MLVAGGGVQVMAASTTTLRYPSYMNNDLMLGPLRWEGDWMRYWNIGCRWVTRSPTRKCCCFQDSYRSVCLGGRRPRILPNTKTGLKDFMYNRFRCILNQPPFHERDESRWFLPKDRDVSIIDPDAKMPFSYDRLHALDHWPADIYDSKDDCNSDRRCDDIKSTGLFHGEQLLAIIE